MSRPLRFNRPDCLYHVTSRGNERREIVRDNRDRRAFVDILGRVVLDRHWTLHAWVLMTNHLHLVVTTREANLSAGMRDLLGCYASRFNAVHDRVGHLFQHRFDAKVVERDRHLLELVRYVPLNPVRSGIVRSPAAWRWSSYRATAGLAPAPDWLDVETTLTQFHPTDRREAQVRFREFVSRGRGVEYDPWSELTDGWILGSEAFCREVQRETETCHSDFGRLVELVKQDLAISDEGLYRRHHRPARKLIAHLAHTECGMTFAEIGERLRMTSFGAAKLERRSRALCESDAEYLHRLKRIREKLLFET